MLLRRHIVIRTDRVTSTDTIVSRHLFERTAFLFMIRRQRKAIKQAPGIVPRYTYDVFPAVARMEYSPRHQGA